MIDPAPFFESLNEKQVSHVWRGHGSAVFVEFGELSTGLDRVNDKANPSGELTLMIEWSWRIERTRSILGGSWSAQTRWDGLLKKLVGARVTSVHVFGFVPEIMVCLSNKLRIVSFNISEGQPSWAVLTRKPELGSLYVKGGYLKVERPSV